MAQHDPYIGKQIGNYRIEQEIASGSFGTVYLARHLHLEQRTVAIKILHAVHLDSEEEKEQFIQKAQTLEILKGLANILPLLDVGIAGNIPYMIAEYAERGSLRMRQRGVPLPLQEALTIIQQVGHGLQNAHNQEIVHRDLKPENILFNTKDEALLADSGISTILSTASIKHTHIAGTPAYMAPEQFRGEVCKESDQYALACIAYELLTGHKLFEAPDFVSMGFLHTTKAPTPPRQLNPQIPSSVEEALLKALSKQRTERYPSVSAFTTALNNIADDDWDALLPIQGQSIPANLPNTPATTGTARRQASIPVTTPSPIPPRRNAGKATATGAVGAVAGAMAGTTLINNAANTGKAPTISTRTTNTGKTPTAPTRNAGAGRILKPRSNTLANRAGLLPPRRPMHPRRMPANRDRLTIIATALAIVTLLVIGGCVALILHLASPLPPATITITPTSKLEQDTYLMQGVTSNADPDNRQVTVRPLSSTQTDTKQAHATGHIHQGPQAATGTITFFNASLSTQIVLSGTTFPLGNVQIVTDEKAVIPAANPPQTGQITVPAHAVQPDTAGNIPATTINQICCGSPDISAQNQNAFTGGTGAMDYNFLTPEDVTGAIKTDQDTLKSNAQNDIKGQMKTGEQLLGDINCDDPKITPDAQPGAHGVNITTANVTISVSCSAEAFDANPVQTIAQNALKQKAIKDLGAAYVLAGNIVTQIQPPTQQASTITFLVTAKGVWYYQLTDVMMQALPNKIKGMSKAQAMETLNTYLGAGNAKIDISNGGNTLPTDVKQIALNVKSVNGL